VLDITMRKQTHTLRKQDMRPTTNIRNSMWNFDIKWKNVFKSQ
jgi:hypothetical protein